ncbi:MAG: Asp-tRNAAsn/Glu-tRNAGln amidotransferase A subunit, GatA [Candidatus Methanohalarchaeum thermophilum]|uniref:Glutamyl-tRNA(Gln) amidotransferase subunit A n=1 Tax=Methanohalarchaeum thermophilum TaxID=1903181 RepID=A0A1Q6DW40_METT1|nr:MAG: Asp-tRNAAsn/Glu-tRNAGln amidotransferase A subunit, GatA [Candidatus Methanohalarchaeum thermophilum]
MNAKEIVNEIKRGEKTAAGFLFECKNKIEKKEEEINAFISLDLERSIEKAKEIDKKIKEGKDVGKLAGLPIAVKDSITTSNFKTTCGSKMLEGYHPPYDSTVVSKIKEEDGIVIGKANCDEFCMGSSTETSYFGSTRNPVDEERVPGGSSGGSAASVKYGANPLALGSDTGGSVRCPASFCGVYGLKPTYGQVSRYGLIAYASSLDQIGPIANSIEGISLLFNVISGSNDMDSTKVEEERGGSQIELSLNDLNIGIPKEFYGEGVDEEVEEKVKENLDQLRDKGAKLKEISIPSMEYALSAYYIVAMSEASSNLARFDGIRYGFKQKMNDNWEKVFSQVRKTGFGEEVRRRIMLGTYALSTGYYEKYYEKALKVRTLLKRDFEKAFKEVDFIITPTMPFRAFEIDEKIEDPLSLYMADILTVPVNMAGLPSLSVPCETNGLPIGLQIIGDSFEEDRIIELARKIKEE